MKASERLNRSARRSLQGLACGLLCAASGLLSACSEAQSAYDTTHQAAFIYRRVATNPALLSSLGGFGIYCKVWYEGGQLHFQNNVRTAATDNLDAAAGDKPYIAISGFIVGKGPDALYVFDRACPNCASADLINHALDFTAVGATTVQCSRCKRIYDLDLGGLPVGGEKGIKLFRYHIDTDGLNNLHIYN